MRLALSIPLILVLALPAWLGARAMRQDRLDRALVASVKRGDVASASRLLGEGAAANAEDDADQSLSLPQRIWGQLRGTNTKRNVGPSCLTLALDDYQFDRAHGWYLKQESRPSNATELARILLRHGADVDRKDPFGETPLLKTCGDMNWDVAVLLVERGANVNVKGYLGYTPLLLAARHNNTEMVKRLALKGATTDVQEEQYGWTPLMYAICYRNEAMVRTLLDARADVRVRASDGQTPLEYARFLEAPRSITRLLESPAQGR